MSLPPLSRYSTSINPLVEREGRRRHANKTSARRPAFMTSRRHLVDDDWGRYEKASNPNVESLTVSTAIDSKPIVVFESSIYDGAVNGFLPAMRASALDDGHRRDQQQQQGYGDKPFLGRLREITRPMTWLLDVK